MTNVIVMSRVSTDEQASQGFSIEYQEETMLRFCQLKNYNVIKSYREDYSAKTFNRPEWKKMMKFIQENKGLVKKIICLRYDRFSRDFNGAIQEINRLAKLGVEIEMVESNVEMTSPEALLTRNIMITLPQIENEKIAIRSKEGSHKARLLGCFTGKAPRGYKNIRIDKNSTLDFSEDAPLVLEAFEKMASGIYSGDEVRRVMNSKGLIISRPQFLNLIRNPLYAGKIYIAPFKGEPEQLIRGLHPPIVTDLLFEKANDILNGKRRNMTFKKDKSDLYPLNKFIECPIHGRSLTGYGARGQKQVIYHYYVCTKPNTKCKRYPIDEAHEIVEKLLGKVQLSANIIKSYTEILEKLFATEDYERKNSIKRLEQEVLNLNNRKEFITNEYMDRKISNIEYNELKSIIDLKLYDTNRTLQELNETLTPFREYLKKNTPLLEDLVTFYKKVDGKTKKKILSCIFDGKLHFDDEKNATGTFTQPIQILINASIVLESSKNKKEVISDLLPCLAPQSGLEPETL